MVHFKDQEGRSHVLFLPKNNKLNKQKQKTKWYKETLVSIGYVAYLDRDNGTRDDIDGVCVRLTIL